jgi:hypothetical protein
VKASRRPVTPRVSETPRGQKAWKALLKASKSAKPSKYRNRKTVADGITFDSAKEARRWSELGLLVTAGVIVNLRRQVPYVLTARIDHRKAGDVGFPMEAEHAAFVGRYIVDFEYFDTSAQQWRYEDVKGFRTPLYRWKAKHFEAQYGVKILET